MSLINEALKRAQEELKRRNSTPYPFDTSKPSKELYQKSKKPFLVFLCSGVFLGAATLLLLTLIIHPDPVLKFFEPQPALPLHTPVPIQAAATTPAITATEASFNIAQTEDSPNQAVVEKEAPLDPLQDSALFNTLTEMISKMVAEQAALATHSEEVAQAPSQGVTLTTQVPENIIKIDENNLQLSNTLQEPKKIQPLHSPIETFLSKLKITGIMFSGSESKVIIDNRIYSLRSKVSDDPELRLSEINPHELVFEDMEGIAYKKKI